jgi:hypothetical protein
MARTKIFAVAVTAFLFVLTACSPDDGMMSPTSPQANNSEETAGLMKGATKVPDAIWADGMLFGTVLTPTALPPHGKFDILYQVPLKDGGTRPISETKPGDKDYNGGRWNVYILKDGESASYENPTSDDDFDTSLFEPAGVRFVCPMIPQSK